MLYAIIHSFVRVFFELPPPSASRIMLLHSLPSLGVASMPDILPMTRTCSDVSTVQSMTDMHSSRMPRVRVFFISTVFT